MSSSSFRLIGSVGTDHHPFPRFLDWVDAAQRQLGCSVLVQRGYTEAQAGLDTVEFMSATELEQAVTDADVVVCHGGPGTMSLAIRCGHRPIVIARDPSLGEHVDDHQQRYTAKLAEEGSIDLAQNQSAFIDLVQAASVRPRAAVSDVSSDDEGIAQSVSRFADLMEQLETGRLPRRRWRDRLLVKRAP